MIGFNCFENFPRDTFRCAGQAPTQGNAKTRAAGAVSSALQLHGQAKYQDALVQWMTAANELISISTANTDAARDAVAKAAEATTDVLCQALACVTGNMSLAPATVTLGSNLNIARTVSNQCTPQVKDIAVSAVLTNRRTAATVLTLSDNLTLNANQANARNAAWQTQGQAGDWIDTMLTGQWQGHTMELARAQAQISAPANTCVAGQPLPAGRFTPFSASEGLQAKAGKSGSSDWEWSVGRNTGSSSQSRPGQMSWTSGKTYYWTFDISSSGQGSFTVRDGAAVVASQTYSASNNNHKMRLGNALGLGISAASDVGSAKISASLTKLEGASISASLATTAAGQSKSVAFYQPSLSNGLAAEGTVRLDFSGSKLPQGTRLMMNVQAGNAQCQ